MDKKEIISLMMKNVTDKSDHLQALISGTRASNTDTKSSMGDKYETSREMLQQEINLLQGQLAEVLEQREIIKKLRIKNNDKVTLGTLVETSMGTFFIASGIGEINYKGIKIIGISVQSPLAVAMKGKKEGDIFSINNTVQQIGKLF